MVLENLTNFQLAKEHWSRAVMFGFFVNIISFTVATVIFEPAAGLVALFLTSAAAFPIVNKSFEVEEGLDVYGHGGFFKRHADVLKIYSGLFLGILLSTSMIYFVSDTGKTADIFQFQLSALESTSIKDRATGSAISGEVFNTILTNNIKVAFVSFLLSVVFGAAAIFIITWNASVIAVFVGMVAKASTGVFSSFGTIGTPLAFLYGIIAATGSIALHGIPEIFSYFISALAGGIISVGLLREEINSERFRRVLKDGVMLMTVAVLMIFVAAAIEAY